MARSCLAAVSTSLVDLVGGCEVDDVLVEFSGMIVHRRDCFSDITHRTGWWLRWRCCCNLERFIAEYLSVRHLRLRNASVSVSVVGNLII